MRQRRTCFVSVIVLLALVSGGAMAADLAAWEDAAVKALPTFVATNVADGVYDIGQLGGEITYEFIVQSNPDETEASMCLIGRRDFGDTQAGLKYEQWNNTGTYGATIFGVADYDFGVATDPGVVTHLAFVSSEASGTTELYVNGAHRGSVASAITLSGMVGIGYGAQDRADADPFFDNFDGEIFGVAIYNRAMSATEVRRNADAYAETPLVVWVSFHEADDVASAGAAGAGFTDAADRGYTDLLEGAGYDVVRMIQTGDPDLSVVNAADLVVISRSVASSSFQGDNATRWNSTVTAPMIVMSGYTTRSSRMGYNLGTNIPDTTGDITLTTADPNHPIFAGVSLADGTMVNPYAGVVSYADGTLARGISIVTDPLDDEATVLATVSAASAETGPVDAAVIAEIPAGATLVHDGGAGEDVLAGYRLLFLSGAREGDGISSETAGLYDLYDDGAQMFLNAVAYMLGKGVPYTYTLEGDNGAAGEPEANNSLDGTWGHDNGSDAWDGSIIGEAAPGGVSALVEDDTTFLRIQDTGDPRSYGFSDPSNRKIYLTRLVPSNLDGTQIEFRLRLATTAPLDGVSPDEPWPAEGIAYHVRDGGKGMVGVAQDGLGVISFSLARGGQPGLEEVEGDVLVMNNLVGDAPSGDVDTEDTAETIVAKNWVAVEDITQWNTFSVAIAAGGTGTHVVTMSVNGGPAQMFDVTAGDGLEGEGSYLAMGSSGTGAVTAFDVDYLAFKPGVIPEPEPEPAPEPEPEPEPVTRR